MSSRLLLLTDEPEAADLVEGLRIKVGPCAIDIARTRADFEKALAKGLAGTRLLAFCSSVIVPGAVLRDLALEAYNIHPGSPRYPGSYPACWAVYEGVERFGGTLHVMNPRVDEGAIIDALWCDVAPGVDSSKLARQASAAALKLLVRWAPVLMSSDEPLARNGQGWTGPKRRVADLARLSPDAPGLDEGERALRRRAIAQALFGPAKLERSLDGLCA